LKKLKLENQNKTAG